MIDRCAACPLGPDGVCIALTNVCERIHEPEIRAAFLARVREYEARYSAEERAEIERAAVLTARTPEPPAASLTPCCGGAAHRANRRP